MMAVAAAVWRGANEPIYSPEAGLTVTGGDA